jgi:putative DNA primase/helicase
LRSRAYAFLDSAQCVDAHGNRYPFNPDLKKVTYFLDALKGEVHVPRSTPPPTWLPGAVEPPIATDMVAVANGLVHLPSGRLLPHTPTFFNLNALDFAFDAAATCPKWMAFLHELWPNDEDAISCLQEIFGYFVANDTRQQKIFDIVGPLRSGKGTIGRVLGRLLGKDNVVAPTLSSLATQFGPQPLIGKSLGIISDARLGGGAHDQQVVVERLLSISGEDTLTVDRKYKAAWTGQLPLRILILTNVLPELPDPSGALASRFVVLTLTRSFIGKEDIHLTDKLVTELPGILNWSINGWRNLQKRGRFDPPASSDALVRQLGRLTSTIGAFLADCCKIGTGEEFHVPVDTLFVRYLTWCEGENIKTPGTKEMFGTNLHAALPSIRITRPRNPTTGTRERRYEGLRLRTLTDDEAEKDDDSERLL